MRKTIKQLEKELREAQDSLRIKNLELDQARRDHRAAEESRQVLYEDAQHEIYRLSIKVAALEHHAVLAHQANSALIFENTRLRRLAKKDSVALAVGDEVAMRKEVSAPRRTVGRYVRRGERLDIVDPKSSTR